MRTSEKLKLAWPALLKMAEKGSVSISYQGVGKAGHALYELAVANSGLGEIYRPLTEAQLLDKLAEMKEAA